MTCLSLINVAGLRRHAFVFLLLALAAVGDDDDDSYEIDRCTRWHHASMLRGESIFIDGGVQLNRDNSSTWLGFSKYIFEVDMSAPWNATTNYTEKRIGRFGNTLSGSNPPNMVRGALYRGPGNDSRVFTFAGSTFVANTSDPDWAAPSSNQYSLWTFDTTLQTWDQYDVSDAVPQRPNWGSVGEEIGAGVGFYLNGQVDRGSSNVLYSTVEYVGGEVSNATYDQITYLDGMIVIDMPTQQARNVSTETLGLPRIAGGLVHAPQFGKTSNGTLVTFGGMRSADPSNNTFTNGELIDFGTVSLCDSFNDENVTWVNQTTTGDIPPPRMDFCTLPAPSAAKDNSSYMFHIHGGYDPIKEIMYDDVYALSLPSFTWTKLYSGDEPRYGHTCHTAANRQMLRVGGSLDANLYAVETTGNIPNLTGMTCDTTEGVKLFDLTDLTWGTYFDYYAPAYQVPQSIVNKIGGTPDGGATMTKPAAGFDAAAITSMFTPPATTSSNPSSDKSKGGEIAGSVIGSLAALCILLGFLFYFLRRRKTRLSEQSRLEESSRPPGPEKGVSELGEESSRHMLPSEGKPVELSGEEGPKELEAGDREAKELEAGFSVGEEEERSNGVHELLADVPGEHLTRI